MRFFKPRLQKFEIAGVWDTPADSFLRSVIISEGLQFMQLRFSHLDQRAHQLRANVQASLMRAYVPYFVGIPACRLHEDEAQLYLLAQQFYNIEQLSHELESKFQNSQRAEQLVTHLETVEAGDTFNRAGQALYTNEITWQFQNSTEYAAFSGHEQLRLLRKTGYSHSLQIAIDALHCEGWLPAEQQRAINRWVQRRQSQNSPKENAP